LLQCLASERSVPESSGRIKVGQEAGVNSLIGGLLTGSIGGVLLAGNINNRNSWSAVSEADLGSGRRLTSEEHRCGRAPGTGTGRALGGTVALSATVSLPAKRCGRMDELTTCSRPIYTS